MDTGFYPGSGSLEEIIPYVLLLIILIFGIVQSTCIYHEIVDLSCNDLLTSLASVYIMYRRPRV